MTVEIIGDNQIEVVPDGGEVIVALPADSVEVVADGLDSVTVSADSGLEILPDAGAALTVLLSEDVEIITTDTGPPGPPGADGAPGPPGPPGAPGEPGVAGVSSSRFFYRVDAQSQSESDPGTAKLRYNADPMSDATLLIIDNLTSEGFDPTALFQAATFDDEIIIQDRDLAATNQVWKMTGPGVPLPDFFTVPVAFVSFSGPQAEFSNNQEVAVLLRTRGQPGPPGPEGPAGPQGEPGTAGPAGAQGPAGPEGPAGAAGTGINMKGTVADVGDLPAGAADGDAYTVESTGDLWVWDSDTSTWINAGAIQGPAGPAGPQGIQGPAGAQGPQGIQGPTGATGATGGTGPAGPEGPQGVKGDTGAQGPIGPLGPQGPAGTTSWLGITDKPTTFPPSAHQHNADDVNAGTLAIARLPVAASGTSNATQVVRADDSRLSDARTPTAHVHPNVIAAGAAGFMTGADKTKLDGIAAGASNYVHPTGDGNLHVPATGTISDGKVLKAGATAGSGAWSFLAKADVGLNNVDNTSDLGKPVSTATQTALNLKAPLANPVFTGIPAAPTATLGTSNTQLATTAFVAAAVSSATSGTITEAPNDGLTYGRRNLGWSLLDTSIDWTDITNKPATFAPSAHQHNASDVNAGVLAIARLPVATSGTSNTTEVVRADDLRLSNARVPTAHTHLWGDITDKPTTFAPAAHSHPQSEVTGLVADLAGKAPTIHTHTVSQISDIATTYQPLDPDLSALAALTGTNTIYYRSGANAWTAVVIGANLTFSGGTLNGLASGQPADPTLTALAGLDATAGLVEQTGADAFAKRALGVAATTSVLTRGDGDGRYSLTSHNHAGVYAPITHTHLWGDITDKPTSFTPSAHGHAQSEITNLVADLALKSPLASPIFTGDPKAPTPLAADNDTSIATTAWVRSTIAAVAARERLMADTTFYVSMTGSDANDGRTSGTAWQTLQYAADWVGRNLDLNGYTLKLQLADGGPYQGAVVGTDVTHPTIFGGGNFWVTGNPSNVAAVEILTTVGAEGFGWGPNPGVAGFISDCKVGSATTWAVASTSGGYLGLGRAGGGGAIRIGRSAASWAYLITAGGGSTISDLTDTGMSIDTGGNACAGYAHAYEHGRINLTAMTLIGTPHWSNAGVQATYGATVSFFGGTTGTATGKKYHIAYPGNIGRGDLTTLSGNVDGTSVIQLGAAQLASPVFTGNPLAPTPAPGDNDTSIATTAFVAAAVSGLATTYQARTAIGDEPPVTPVDNQLWWESDTGILRIRYNDGSSTQWVSAAGEKGEQGPIGATGPAGAQGNPGPQGLSGLSGIFRFSTTTVCVFAPYNGNQVNIAGTARTIPAAGVSFSNSGLGNSTLYNAYLYWNGSALVGEFSTTASTTDTATGNRVKTGDATRTYIGAVYTSATGTFRTPSVRVHAVRSWFNRDKPLLSHLLTARTFANTGSFVAINTADRISVLALPDEKILSRTNLTMWSSASGMHIYTGIMINGIFSGGGIQIVYDTNYFQMVATTITYAEGFHTFDVAGMVESATTVTLVASGYSTHTVEVF